MAIIASNAVGSSVHLVRDYYNGYIFKNKDALSLANAMYNYSSLSPAERIEMCNNSILMSRQFSPDLWVHTILSSYYSNNSCYDK